MRGFQGHNCIERWKKMEVKRVLWQPCFWGKNGGVAIDYFRLTIEYWAKIKGGVGS